MYFWFNYWFLKIKSRNKYLESCHLDDIILLICILLKHAVLFCDVNEFNGFINTTLPIG